MFLEISRSCPVYHLYLCTLRPLRIQVRPKGYIFPRHPFIPPELVCSMYILGGPVIPFQQVGMPRALLGICAPVFPQVQLDTSAVPDTNCAQTGAV